MALQPAMWRTCQQLMSQYNLKSYDAFHLAVAAEHGLADFV